MGVGLLGLFDFLSKKEKSWDEINVYVGETPPCPNCGTPLVKRFVYSEMYCLDCRYGLDDDDDDSDDDSETLNVYEAAQIWASNGKDEDYMFGYSWTELEAAL
ncbi:MULTISPECIES: hypothetical protein [unclassified Arthrobacter]|uniref:hypothetical protein n=1 Tax=unclassified Arthrobacter TaxID=235627 RepID=UPI0021076E5D|nr:MULTISPECIES: hypothetical protein [unclassified Arthrobacter]MCQ1945511.1 hypothetical protein [Arthrobacter sp. zg-Y1116]